MTIVAKFGGTSMATATSIRQVASILNTNPQRKICVVSAPGNIPGSDKMTDALLHKRRQSYGRRTMSLLRELNQGYQAQLVVLAKLLELESEQTDAARISFGEWLSAYLLAQVTGWRLVDASEVIIFCNNTVQVNIVWEEHERVIIPGFYGYDADTNTIKLFPRGGSDITAALIAEKVQADLCERWTDVSGVFNKDPRYYQGAIHYARLTYPELLAVAEDTFQIFHPEGITPLQMAQIPLRIMNTFAAHEPGTLIQ